MSAGSRHGFESRFPLHSLSKHGFPGFLIFRVRIGCGSCAAPSSCPFPFPFLRRLIQYVHRALDVGVREIPAPLYCNLNRRVPERLLDVCELHARLDEDSREVVPQVVKPHAAQPRPFQNSVKDPSGHARTSGAQDRQPARGAEEAGGVDTEGKGGETHNEEAIW